MMVCYPAGNLDQRGTRESADKGAVEGKETLPTAEEVTGVIKQAEEALKTALDDSDSDEYLRAKKVSFTD